MTDLSKLWAIIGENGDKLNSGEKYAVLQLLIDRCYYSVPEHEGTPLSEWVSDSIVELLEESEEKHLSVVMLEPESDFSELFLSTSQAWVAVAAIAGALSKAGTNE